MVGGGPAGVSAAVAAARRGASVTLLERYAALGGLASGGMVLVLDDMINGYGDHRHRHRRRVRRAAWPKLGLAVYPPERGPVLLRRRRGTSGAAGAPSTSTPHVTPKPICYAVAFDPDGWKRVSNDLVRESGVNLRLHSWFSRPIVDDGVMQGVVCETKSGPQAVMGDVVIDTTGDIDVASRAGAPFVKDSYLTTLVFRLGGVDTDAAERFEQANPKEARAINRKIKRLLGGAWELWWLKTPIPGVVWCNAPHMTGYDGTDPVSLTAAEFDARDKISEAVDYVRAQPARLRELLHARRRRADGRAADPAARGRVRRHQGRRRRAGGTSPTRWPAAATTTRRTGRCCPRTSTSCSSPAGTTRPPRRRSRSPARSRRAWRRARPPASPPRIAVAEGHPRPRGRPPSTSSGACATRAPTRATSRPSNATIDAPQEVPA